MWVIAVDALVALAGLGLLGLLAWRVVIRPGMALSRSVTDVAVRAGDALSMIAERQTAGELPPADTRRTSAGRLWNEGIDVPLN